MKRPGQFRRASLFVLLGPLVLIAVAVPGAAREGEILLVVEAARDTAQGFRAQVLPELRRRALTWPDGVITLPDTAVWLEHPDDALAFRLDAARLDGVGAAGRFRARDGDYEIDTPLYLTDGQLVACLTAGRLSVDAGQIVYRAPGHRRDQRGNLLLLGGIILATAVLLRAARRRSRGA